MSKCVQYENLSYIKTLFLALKKSIQFYVIIKPTQFIVSKQVYLVSLKVLDIILGGFGSAPIFGGAPASFGGAPAFGAQSTFGSQGKAINYLYLIPQTPVLHSP